MIKKILISLLVLFLTAVMLGLYPVALVDRSLILARTFQKTEEAKKNFINTQAKSLKLKPIDFSASANKELASTVKKQVLTLLIEDKIVELEGIKILAGFGELAQKRLDSSLQDEKDISMDKAVHTVYNLNLADFRKLILLPQARRDTLRVFLADRGENFEEWIAKRKSEKKIRLFFQPFAWDGKEIK